MFEVIRFFILVIVEHYVKSACLAQIIRWPMGIISNIFPVFLFTQLFLFVYATFFSFTQLFLFVYAAFFLLTCCSIRSSVQCYSAL